MIDLARASIAEIDDRVTRIGNELDSLNALRAAWERYLALTESPGQARADGKAPARARRAPTAKAVASAPTSSARVGTPAPASPKPNAAEVAKPDAEFRCPDCPRSFRTAGALGPHRAKTHGYRANGRDARKPTVDHPGFPGAPPGSRVEDGFLVIGEEAWTQSDWEGQMGGDFRRRKHYPEPAFGPVPGPAPAARGLPG